MKIRTGFVTNSSSSSYITISITSEKLAEILKEYEKKLERSFECFELDGEECRIEREDFDEIPSKLNNVMNALIKVLRTTTDCKPLLSKLTKQKSELLASIEEVDWSYEEGIWGDVNGGVGYDDADYSEETLKKVYAKIAKKKGCSVDEVTSDDFVEYVIDNVLITTRRFTYSKAKGGNGEYCTSHKLEDL